MTPTIPPGLLVAAPASGTGKTTLMLGLLAAFRRQGVAVQPFKCGPDYIDPAFHTAASGRPSYNLDSWAMAPDLLDHLLTSATGADLVLAEGSMGLFDGVATNGASGNGASADIAARAGWPVVLILDVSGQAQSAAAVALGFSRLRADVDVAGVVLNRVASVRHEALVRDGMAAVGIPVFGALPRRPGIALPERHLGLVQAEELPRLETLLGDLATLITDHVDLPRLRAAATVRDQLTPCDPVSRAVAATPPGQRIALARDAAFSFIYPHLLAAWRSAGAEILPFSPLADEGPDKSADVCWLPGGYPELHAGRLAAAARFKSALVAFARTRRVHGECGGYMALGEALVDASGTSHAMVGLLGLVTSFAARRMHLGYRAAQLMSQLPGYPVGARLRGHEFHYATILAQPDAPLAVATDASGAIVAETGSHRGHASGSFFHLIAGA